MIASPRRESHRQQVPGNALQRFLAPGITRDSEYFHVGVPGMGTGTISEAEMEPVPG